MKYRQLILHKGIPDDTGLIPLTVSFYSDNIEREDIETTPNTLGFYYFPEGSMTDQEAFDKLRNTIIIRSKQEIINFENTITYCKNMKIDNSHKSCTQ
jgi:hypothetical protein